jgi:hypothetical protein
MQERDIQALNIGAFMNGMLSVFCTIRSSIFESNEYTLEITLRNEGDRALRNFLITVGSTPGIKFENDRDLFRVSNIAKNISFLRAGQTQIINIEIKSLLDNFSGDLKISATPSKNLVLSEIV